MKKEICPYCRKNCVIVTQYYVYCPYCGMIVKILEEDNKKKNNKT